MHYISLFLEGVILNEMHKSLGHDTFFFFDELGHDTFWSLQV
jgi:hypothetical protein